MTPLELCTLLCSYAAMPGIIDLWAFNLLSIYSITETQVTSVVYHHAIGYKALIDVLPRS